MALFLGLFLDEQRDKLSSDSIGVPMHSTSMLLGLFIRFVKEQTWAKISCKSAECTIQCSRLAPQSPRNGLRKPILRCTL